MQPAEQGLSDGLGNRPDQAEALAAARARSADQRGRLADQRDRAADQRDRIADAREAAANRRDQMADEREAQLNEREAWLDERVGDQPGPDRRMQAQAAFSRSADRVTRSTAALNRDDAARRRDEAARTRQVGRAARGQVELSDELARTARERKQSLQETIARSGAAIARAQALRGRARNTYAQAVILRDQFTGSHGGHQTGDPQPDLSATICNARRDIWSPPSPGAGSG